MAAPILGGDHCPVAARGARGPETRVPLLTNCGFFHRAHQAIDDRHALLAFLDRPVQASSQLALAALLETARKPTVQLGAQGSPIENIRRVNGTGGIGMSRDWSG